MKKLLILLFVLIPLLASAQEKQTVVTLKSGTELKGVIKSIDPTDALIIVIAGIETTIKMDDVARIEEYKETIKKTEKPQLANNEKLVVTDFEDYPDSFFINVCGTKIKMILVRGGDMNMGFDGKGSIDMNSQPVHKVSVTSFYLSETCIKSELALQLTDNKFDKTREFYIGKWVDVDAMAKKIGQITNLPIRMPTEAEWEFAACSDKQGLIFKHNDDDEFCSDYFAEFVMESITDPSGPVSGRRHVVRYYGKGNRRFDRDHSDSANRLRLAIKAKDLKQ